MEEQSLVLRCGVAPEQREEAAKLRRRAGQTVAKRARRRMKNRAWKSCREARPCFGTTAKSRTVGRRLAGEELRGIGRSAALVDCSCALEQYVGDESLKG